MPTVHTIPTDYATLTLALANANVKDGDTIQMHGTHVENSEDITISKEVTLKTLGSGQATISKRLIINASNIQITNLRLNSPGLSDGHGMMKHSGADIKNFTVNYCTIDGLPAAATNDNGGREQIIFRAAATKKDANGALVERFGGIFTFDNNTVMSVRSGACIELGQTAEGCSLTEFYCRDNNFIDHMGAIVCRGGNYSEYQGAGP